MKIGYNGLRLARQRFGIGRYIEYTLKNMDPLLEPDEQVIVYVRDDFNKATLGLSEQFEVRQIHSRLDGVWWENFELGRRWREVDVLFNPSYTVPLTWRGPQVVATHSANEILPGAHEWWYDLTYRPRNRISARKADAVIVPTETAKVDIQRLYKVPAEKIDIVPEGVDDSFGPVEAPEALRAVRERYLGADVPYVLFVGKFSLRRNIPNLVRAFGQVKRQENLPHKLLLYGKNVHGQPIREIATELGISDDVVEINEQLTDHRTVLPIYSGADLFVHPTAYEGFSLTIVEAMSCGAPVVTVGRGAVAEIVGDAALTVDDPTPEKLAEQMRRALTDPQLRASMRQKGLERSKLWRFSECARGNLDVLRRVAGK